MKKKLARALLRRKELMAKVSQLHQIKKDALFEVKMKRVQISESIDDLTVQIPLLSAAQVTEEFDWHARALREIDALIQQTNWTTDVEVPDWIEAGYTAPELKR